MGVLERAPGVARLMKNFPYVEKNGNSGQQARLRPAKITSSGIMR